MAEIRIGISGWSYKGWRGGFYPEDLPRRRELEYASRQMNTIEINGSFYSLQRPGTYRNWYEQTPSDFVFAVKGGRFITHMKKLKDARVPLANFFASGVLRLADKLGPFLWQLPENFGFNPDRVARFLDLLPKNTQEAADLARHHNQHVGGRSWLQPEHDGPIRHAVEVRHPSFMTAEFAQLLRQHNAALVVSDAATDWPAPREVTADFVYVRFHGSEELYTSRYSDDQLDHWAERIQQWQADDSRDVYAYFNNDAKGHAPFDAQRLAARLA